MEPVPTQLPPLSPADRTRFARFVALDEDAAALAKETGADLLDLYLWLARPDIAAWLAFHRQLHDRALRNKALARLADVAASTNPIERRRAATTILRALNSGRPPAPRGGPKPPTTPRKTDIISALARVAGAPELNDDAEDELLDRLLVEAEALVRPAQGQPTAPPGPAVPARPP